MRDYAKKQDWMKSAPIKPRQRRGKVEEPTVVKSTFVITPGMWMVSALLVAVIAIVILWRVGSDWVQPYKNRPTIQQAEATKIDDQKKPAEIVAAKPTQVVSQPEPPKPAKIVEPEHPKFEFYSMLANAKVETKDSDAASETESKQFNLQVASYQEEQAAEALRARLILIGLKPTIDKTGSSDHIWYRVDLGPYDSMRAADVIRHRLQDNGINGSMIRQIN